MRVCAFCAALVLCAFPAFGQRGGASPPGGAAPAPGGAPGGSPSRSIPNSPGTNNTGIPNNNPGIPNNNNPNTNFPNPQTYFLSGKVMLDDGAPASPDIRIEKVCAGRARLETYTDSKGRFSFQLGGPVADVDTDAADDASSQIPGQARSFPGSGSTAGFGSNPYWNCELRAAYPGYTSETLNLGTLRPFDTQLGTIVLHRVGGSGKATTISVTSALAPKRAQKDYRKALDLISKKKFEQAEKHLVDATTAYPKYAVAWYELGRLQARENQLDAARQSFQSAVSADSHYMTPYDQLAGVSAQQKRWDEAVKYSNQVNTSNPDAFPSAYWYNALGNYELKNFAAAEKSIRELMKIDKLHEYPETERMLTDLLVRKGDYADAALHLQTYLKMVPNAKDATQLRQALPKIQQAAAQASAQAKAQTATQAKQ
jgi:tetratricopeptide (TPR) repeat protein